MKAMEFYKESLRIIKPLFGDKHIEQAAILNNVALIL